MTEGTGTVALPDATCRLVTSCTVSNPNSVARDALAIGVGNFRVDHTVGTHDEGTIRLSTSATPTCANFPLLAGDSKFDAHINQPTGCCMEGVSAASKTFSLPANSSVTIRMYAAMVLGAGAIDEVARGTLDCFLPWLRLLPERTAPSPSPTPASSWSALCDTRHLRDLRQVAYPAEPTFSTSDSLQCRASRPLEFRFGSSAGSLAVRPEEGK